jgi:hypothetical protein
VGGLEEDGGEEGKWRDEGCGDAKWITLLTV